MYYKSNYVTEREKTVSLQIFFSYFMSSINIYPSIYYYLPHHPPPPLSVQPCTSRWPEIFFSSQIFAAGGGAPGGCCSVLLPTKTCFFFHDLENHPYDFPENLHTGLESNPKNYFLLAFFRIFSKSWSKTQQKLPMDIKNATFRLLGPITFSRVPGATRVLRTLLFSILGRVRGQIFV